jgi:PAS domain S-box-containing protein
MNDNKSPESENKRVEALRLYDILDTLPEQEYDDITRLASEICQTPIALISLVDENRQWFKSKIGLDVEETPRDVSFCAHAINEEGVFEVGNAALDERFMENPLVAGAPNIRFYAGAPLISKDGYRVGTLCVINSVPYSINESQKNSLLILARSVISMLELRKQKREAELFKKALDEVTMVSMLNARLEYEYVNEKFCALADMEASEIIGKNVTDIPIADISKQQEQDALDVVKEGKIYASTVRNLNHKGVVSWSKLVLIPFRDRNGQLVKTLSLRNDITQELMMLERLEEAEMMAGMGNWEYDVISGTRYWSRGLYEIMEFQYPNNLAISPTLLDMVQSPEDQQRLNQNFHDVIQNNAPAVPLEFAVLSHKGNERIVSVITKKRVNSKGQLTAIYGTVQDITEKKHQDKLIRESEAKYRTLVENSAQMTYTTDVDGAYTYASAHLKKTIGFNDEDILGKKFAFIYDDEWRKKTIIFYVNQLQEKIEETKFVFPIRSSSGKKLWVEQTADLIWENGKITGFRCVLHDVTQNVESEEAMAEAVKLAREAREMQQTFLGKMSHEIRTPMNGVIGMANLLNETELNERQKIYTDSIRESAHNMLRIINDILDITKIESGKLVFEETEVSVNQIVSNVVFNLKPVADEKRVLIASQIDPRIPATLIADPVRLNQVLLNLAGNAIKFTEKGSVIISVSLMTAKKDAMVLEFKVADTGIGIDPQKLDRVFESFTQAESDTTRKYGGTGLGLTIARQIVEQQQGVISVASEPGSGTTFTFTFNFKIPDNPATASVPEMALKRTVHSFKGREILLVEDNVMNQRVALFTLENWQANVTIADRGYKAIEALKTHKFDVILMDLQMPEMSGIQATEIIRQELDDKTPIIAMTASAMNMEREKCFEAGMNDYISKPFEPETLNAIIYASIRDHESALGSRIITLDYIRQLAGNDEQLIFDLFDIYTSQAADILKAIAKHISSGNYKELHSDLHNMKNSVGILGAKNLYDMLASAEMETTNGTISDETLLLLSTTISDLVRRTIEEVKAEMRSMKKAE